MSARPYSTARDKNQNYSKVVDYLPDINTPKFGCRAGKDLPPPSGNKNSLINRNIDYSFPVQPYDLRSIDRASTPFSDFFSESETGTPDFRSEESDSSVGSTLQNNTNAASEALAAEWERIERTLYDEDGEKTTRPSMVEECRQWRELHPQLRVVGRAIRLPEKKQPYRQIEHEEIHAIHYSDYNESSEDEERVSESSNDVTPQNSPRYHEDYSLLSRQRIPFYGSNDVTLTESFCSLLQITPMQIRTPAKKRQNSSILKSEIASSRWMRNHRPESPNGRNSAKSFISLDTTNLNNPVLSASERDKTLNSRVVTARNRDISKLEPLYTPELPTQQLTRLPGSSFKRVSLPPLLLEDERRKNSSAKKTSTGPMKSRKSGKRTSFNLDRLKRN